MDYSEAANRIAKRPGGSFQQWFARRLFRRFLRQSKLPVERFLEVGSGAGRIAEEALRAGISYSGMEPTENLRNLTQKRIETVHKAGGVLPNQAVEIFEYSLPNLDPTWDNTFSHIFTLHVFEHASSVSEAYEWLDEVSRVLKPGGKVLIATPDVRSYRWSFYDSDWTHTWPTTPSRVASLASSLGLVPVREQTITFGFSGILGWLLQGLGRFFPFRVVDYLFLTFGGLRNFGTGIMSVFFWGLSWVILEKPESA